MPFGLVFGAVVFAVLGLWAGVRAAIFGPTLAARVGGIILIVLGVSLSLGLIKRQSLARWIGVVAAGLLTLVGPGGSGQTRLEVAKESLEALIREVDDLGNVNVQIIPFSAGASNSGWFVDDIYGALDFLNALSAGGGTYYDDALNAQINSGPPPAADQSLIYFVSDGESSNNHGVDNTVTYTTNGGTTLNGQAAWEAYVDENADIAFGIGIGSASLAELQQVAHPLVNGSDDYAITVSDPNELTVTLLETVTNNIITGSLDVLGANGAAGFVIGADGGYISEITIAGTTYTYSPGDPVNSIRFAASRW